MAAAPHAHECAARLQVQGPRQQQLLPDDALQLVFDRLPLEEQVFAVGAVCRAWRQRAQPRQLELHERRPQPLQHWEKPSRIWSPHHDYYGACAVPLWLAQKAWPALTGAKRGHLFCRAARHGDVGALRWMWEQQPTQTLSVFYDPVRPVPVLDHDDQACLAAATAAAKGGHLEALQLLRALRPACRWSERVCAAAAGSGQLAALQWMRAQDPPCPWDREHCLRIAAYAAREWIEQQPDD